MGGPHGRLLFSWLVVSLGAAVLGVVGGLPGGALGPVRLVDTVQAQSGQTVVEVSLQPNVIDLSLAPGESAERTLTLRYPDGPPTEASLELFDFFNDASGAIHLVPVGSPSPGHALPPVSFDRWASAAWITLPASPITLRAGDERTLRVNVSVPASAEPGERRAIVLVGLTDQPATGGIGVIARLGARIYTKVLGSELRRVEDVRLGVEHRGLLPWGSPIELVATLRNTGTTHVRSRGDAVVRDWLGGPTVTVSLPDRRVLPGEVARLAGRWPGPPVWRPVGRYTVWFSFADETVAAAVPPGEIVVWVVNWGGVGAMLGVVVGLWGVRANRLIGEFLRRLRLALAVFRAG